MFRLITYIKILCILLLIPGISNAQTKINFEYQIESNPGISVGITLLPISFDSIILNTKLVNLSSDSIALYKPLLPDEKYVREQVIYIQESNSAVPLRYEGIRDYSQQYIKKDGKTLPLVLPKLNKETIIWLHANDTLSLSMNLVNFYKLDSFLIKKKKLWIFYYANMPIIIDSLEQKKIISRSKKKQKAFGPAYYHFFCNHILYIPPDQVVLKY